MQPYCCDSKAFTNDDARIDYNSVCFSDASALLPRRPVGAYMGLVGATLLSLYMLLIT